MAVLLGSGIERVLHQPRLPDSNSTPIFPDQKAHRPLGIHEPSNLERIFNTSYTRQLINKMIYPKIPESDVVLPGVYNETLDNLRKKIMKKTDELHDIDPKKLKNAQQLLEQMHSDYEAFCRGRDQLVQS